MSALRDNIAKGNGYFFKENLLNARTLFRYRVDLFECKMNFKNKREYKNDEKLLCDSCESESEESTTHILFCPAYSLIRENKQLNNDTHLAEYLQQVLEIRTRLRLNR